MLSSLWTCSDPTSTLEPSWPSRGHNHMPVYPPFLRAPHLLPQFLLINPLRGEQRGAAASSNLRYEEAVPH